jgi:hypothetical protein
VLQGTHSIEWALERPSQRPSGEHLIEKGGRPGRDDDPGAPAGSGRVPSHFPGPGLLVAEVAPAREDHRQVMAVGDLDRHLVAA